MRGFGDIAERLRRSTVQIVNGADRGRGSGIVWSADGLILTNAHVARTSRSRNRALGRPPLPGPRRLARPAPRPCHPAHRWQTATPTLEPAAPGDSTALRPGELVIAIGNPLGFAGALSTGVIHSVGRLPGMGSQSWIRADVQLAPGNSGGPLANAEGQVIGINTAIVNGLGVAVPAHTALEFLRRGAPPSLGVVLRPVPLGLLLLEVDPEGAAANASLLAGDILLTRYDALATALDSGRPTLKLQFLRGDRTRVREAVVRLAAGVEAAA